MSQMELRDQYMQFNQIPDATAIMSEVRFNKMGGKSSDLVVDGEYDGVRVFIWISGDTIRLRAEHGTVDLTYTRNP